MKGFTTRALGGWRRIAQPSQRGLAPPIHQTATFAFDDMDDFAAVARSKIDGGYLYSRWANPTVDAIGAVIADLEGAGATACFGSGMAAIAGAFAPLVKAGDHVVSASQLYGGSAVLFGTAFPRAGITVTKVDVHDHGAVEAAIGDTTRVLYVETIGNPTIDVADIDALAAIARTRGLFTIVDATFTPPCILRPIEHGIDLVLHSATKYLGGHSDITAGVVSGSTDLIARVRHAQIDSGAILAPFEAWLLNRGVQTLDLRMDRICANALALARMLEEHRAVSRVLYPGLPSHPQHGLAVKLLGERFGGMLACELGGGLAAGRQVMERVRVAAAAASLGGTKTLITHPASVTHTQLSAAEREAVGITDGMLRISVGIEDPADLLSDLDEALR